jgi:uncharacterized protein (DUF433 family)
LFVQVWLLLAFTALANDVEAEATATDHEKSAAGEKQHSGENGDDGGIQGHGHKKELSENQKIVLKKILRYLESDDPRSVMGDFTYDGQRVPIDFVMTAMYIDLKSTGEVTVEDLWEIIQLYKDYAKKVESEPRIRDISKYDQVTLLYVKTYIRNNGMTKGSIIMDGAKVPVDDVSYWMKAYSGDIPTAKIQELRVAIRASTIIHRYHPISSPMAEEPTKRERYKVKALLDFLKTQGSTAMGSCVFSIYRISIRFILWYLDEHGRSVEDVKIIEMWNIIRAYIPEIEEFKRMPEKERTILKSILTYLKFLGDGAIGEVTFRNHTLPIDFIMTVVLLQGADIYSLTTEDLWELTKMYGFYEKKLESEPQSQNISKSQQVTLLYAITCLRNDDGLIGQIVVEGVKIQVSYLLNQLKKLEEDIHTVNIEQIHKVISACISKYTPPTPVLLGNQPTEEQTLKLNSIIYLLKTQRSAAMGSFTFSGYRISVQFILSYLSQRGLTIEDLGSKELWRIMLLYESNEKNTTSTTSVTQRTGRRSGTTERADVSGTGNAGSGSWTTKRTNEGRTVPTGPQLNDTLPNILKNLFTKRINVTGYIEFWV